MHLDYLNKRGFIKSPVESDASFKRRIKQFSKITCRNKLPCQILDILEQEYGVRPDWIEVEYNNKGLMPWHGGVTIIEESGDNIISAKIRVRKKKSIFSIYDTEEILTHEAVHMVRMTFPDSIYEEILAYRLSKKRWRRYWGALFYSPSTTLLFLISLLTTFNVDLGSIVFNINIPWKINLALKLTPLTILTWPAIKLIIAQRKLYICAHKINKNPWHKIIKMSDHQITSAQKLAQSAFDGDI